MGFFNKKEQKIRKIPPPPPPTASQDDLHDARRLVQDFLVAVGNDARMRVTALAVSRAGGGPKDFESALRNSYSTGDTGMDRPWHWLVAVSREARTAGDVALIAAVALFVNIWDTQLRHKILLADTADMMLGAPPTDVTKEIYSIAVLTLPGPFPSQTVVDNATGSVKIHEVQKKCAIDALGAGIAISPEVRAAAQLILNRQ
ncbi:hypothetical protein C7C45_26055 [Micromonospora arborensis]|uniref:Uncharacterized protein n=1 Tax=Micromonospora arborensis TaxID=2116518 RepID=A0A318NCY1_9ACTN|nr:hypothetical protein [Micromonospora arborensis]PYC66191.1 hypothetical protein C7C45_26055 [Micromonospora arborensis]